MLVVGLNLKGSKPLNTVNAIKTNNIWPVNIHKMSCLSNKIYRLCCHRHRLYGFLVYTSIAQEFKQQLKDHFRLVHLGLGTFLWVAFSWWSIQTTNIACFCPFTILYFALANLSDSCDFIILCFSNMWSKDVLSL